MSLQPDERIAAEQELASRTRALADSEQRLRDQSHLLQHILKYMGDGVAVADREGRFLLFNPAARRILGADPPDLPRECWSEYFHFCLPDGHTPYPPHDLPLQRALRGLSSDDVEIFVRHPDRPDGSWISTTARPILDEAGNVAGGVTVIRDLTERKQSDQDLQFQKSLLEAQGQASIDGILAVSQTGRVLWFNRRFLQLWHIPQAVMENRTDEALLRFVHDNMTDPDAFMARVRHLYEHPAERSRDEITLKDGRTFDRYSAPIVDTRGRYYGRVWFFRDVTGRKVVEEQLREREQHFRALAEHNRRLAREVEHRVGNNLAALIGLVGAMRGRVPDVEQFAEAIDARLRAMSRVHRLLATTGWDNVALGTLVKSALELMQAMACHRAREEVSGPDVSVPAASVLPLMQTLVELYTNSCKYGAHSAPGGCLRVSWEVRRERQSDSVRLRWQEKGGPPTPPAPAPSLGTELITSFVTRELGGSCDLRYPPGGADHLIEFPVAPSETETSP
ncbi:MAG TPA: PAS domain-containing protein [Tepidisphaeraceae bacterium]